MAQGSALCEIIATEPGRLLVFDAGTPEMKYTRWTYALEPDGAGAKVTESFELLAIPPQVEGASEERKAQRTAMLIEGMHQTLTGLKEAVEGA